MAITVQVLSSLCSGLLCEVEAERNWTWENVKRVVGQKLSTPSKEQRLLHDAKVLEDGWHLSATFPKGLSIVQVQLVRLPPDWVKAYDAVDRDPMSLKYQDEIWKADRDIALLAVRKKSAAWNLVSCTLKDDREFTSYVVSLYPAVLTHASKLLLEDRSFVLQAASQVGCALRYVPDNFKYDRKFVLDVVKVNPNAISNALPKFRDDRELILAAVEQRRCLLKCYSKRQYSILAVVEKRGCLLKYASESLRGDRDVVLAAVTNDWQAFEHAVGPSRQDKEIFSIVSFKKADAKRRSFVELSHLCSGH